MDKTADFSGLEVGYDVPALPGMAEGEIQTPCLVLDLDALERNIRRMGDFARERGMRLRVHGKMHKSVDVARLQHEIGGAEGICCQKVSEAEAFARGGIRDILVTNEVRDPVKLDRLARVARSGARILVCVDDLANVDELSAAATRHGAAIECLVEIDCGGRRCGVGRPEDAVAIARAVAAAPGLSFAGVQAYHGSMQHIERYADRKSAFSGALAVVRDVVDALRNAGLPPALVTGGGTGSYRFESGSGVFNELQCGSYAFMDADYGRVRDEHGERLDAGEWQNALFVLTSILSTAQPGVAVCDAGLKVLSVDSGLPLVWGRHDVTFTKCVDEHGIIADPEGVLGINDRLRLVPGHCDPTCNLHDWYVGVRAGQVETLWPVSARGKAL